MNVPALSGLQDVFQLPDSDAIKQKIKNYIKEHFDLPSTDDIAIDVEKKVIVVKIGPSVFRTIAGKFAPALLDKVNLGSLKNTFMRVLGSTAGDGIQEVRFDWELGHAQRPKLDLPAISVSSPAKYRLSLVLQNSSSNGTLPHLAYMIASFDPAHTDRKFTLESNFAWNRGEKQRELHNDDKRADKPPLLKLDLEHKKNAEGVSLALLAFDLKETALPDFLQFHVTPITPLQLPVAGAKPDAAGTSVDFRPFNGDWGADFDFNLEDNADFTLPFLKKNKGAGGNSPKKGIEQFISVKKGAEGVEVKMENSEVKVPLDMEIKFGKLVFGSGIDLFFNWRDFAFRVEHDGGIKMLTKEKVFQFPDFLGLRWRFEGAKVPDSASFHLFTLVTKDYNYQLQMAPGARLIIEFTKLSDEPISFAVSDFAISSNGVSLTAEVLNQPTRLRGIDTKFSFEGTKITIVENKIQDFTLTGSGPLPPALVGDAMVDIMLQFSQDEDGDLKLMAGGAKLQKNKLLEAKNTRFQFQIDSIGLKFVNENGYHLFFIMTGAASFVPNPRDKKDGPLSPLSKIKIEFVDCPLTGDVKVLGKHIKFLVELPKPARFQFLGCFTMEIRGLGFLPSADPFDGDPAMLISGQIMFAVGGQDTKSARVDFHGLYIGVPAKGSFLPRIHLKNLALEIQMGAAFRIAGSVSFVDNNKMSGFTGSGLIEIKGLPTMSATFSFMRVRRDADGQWLRAWFIYLEVGRISLEIPVVHLYLREVGLGFGYRYTLTSIKAAEESKSTSQLIQELRRLSRTQGNLSSQDAWALDLEEPGQDPRWTIVLRAMISQTSASSPLKYNAAVEKFLICTFLFDVVIAFRSDLTFLMAARAWLNTNYNDFLEDVDGIRNSPLFSGFMYINPRRKRLLASIATNPDGKLGQHPPFPDFVNQAVKNSQFSLTLLIEPGLFHYEMGWPNMLRWGSNLAGILEVEQRGGFVFRITTSYILLGVSFVARGKLELKYGVDLGVVGAEVYALAQVAYGGRLIAVAPFANPLNGMMVYGAIGLDLRVEFRVRFWIDLWLFSADVTFSLFIAFTASLELGLKGVSPGLRGQGTISVGAMGRSIRMSIHVGLNESVINEVQAATAKYMDVGLEASDVPAEVPGVAGSSKMALSAARKRTAAEPLHLPGYHAFVIRPEKEGDPAYFMLYPQGEDNGEEERGFLPVPPALVDANASTSDGARKTVMADFSMRFPANTLEKYDIRHFDAEMQQLTTANFANNTLRWKVNWNAVKEMPVQNTKATPTRVFRIADLISGSFVDGERDPEPLPPAEKMVDDRVQNPSDSAFEAAVRGAFEQFEGSPYFKKDLNNAYEQNLSEALGPDTTVYSETGLANGNPNNRREHDTDQLRGVIISQMVNDFKNFVQRQRNGEDTSALTEQSVAFQLGLVFEATPKPQFAGSGADWLEDLVDDESLLPSISQRLGADAEEPVATTRPVSTFNIRNTGFDLNPPQFQRVRHYTDANTIAITWDLEWNTLPDEQLSGAQAEPEHHLQHYRVLRRALDNGEPDVQYTVKSAAVLHRTEGGSVLKALQPRFHIVDHFNQESLEEQAALPANGRSYLFTITPVDFTEQAGRPLSVVATRFPNQPPMVPVESELTVSYTLDKALLQSEGPAAGDSRRPPAVLPSDEGADIRVHMWWKEPIPNNNGPQVAIDKYSLLFRREQTLPVGSYELDGLVQGARNSRLPTSNARPLPTDIRIELDNFKRSGLETNAEIPISRLQDRGVMPTGEWRPEAWSVFFQTISVNNVPSALIPVNLIVRFDAIDAETPSPSLEERRPAHLEWLPVPLRYNLLPPEDQQAETGAAHFPMPQPAADGIFNFHFEPTLSNIGHRRHPAGVRAIRFRWNQGPSANPDYPLALHAGYSLLQLDADAHTVDTFHDAAKLADALQEIQEVQMAPADDLLLLPADTLTTSQWEAWYPSDLLRQRGEQPAISGSETPLGPWYSWRESYLDWPAWPGLTEPGDQDPQRLPEPHPLLNWIIKKLEGQDPENPDFLVQTQVPPPVQPETELEFLNNTAPKNDRYGWGVLQRFGLSVTFSIHNITDGTPMVGQALLEKVNTVLADAANESDVQSALPYLFVELLFQPGKAVELAEKQTHDTRLLALIQLSLRPRVVQGYHYAELTLSGNAGELADLSFSVPAGHLITLVQPEQPAFGEKQLLPSGQPVVATVEIPANGKLRILLRAKNATPTLPAITPRKAGSVMTSALLAFEVTDERSTYFTAPPDWVEDMSGSGATALQWLRFKRLAEAGNSNQAGAPVIAFPTEKNALAAILPTFMNWSLRFMQHSPPVGIAETAPWVATAYPRVNTPAYTTPDGSGRLQYDHLLEDPWAHNYRFYIRPYGRYDRLWASLRQSTALFPTAAPIPLASPQPDSGGLDVVLERTKSVAPPVVLSSRRLDIPAKPGSPAIPGAVWEVIVAQHPEQALIERNQTLFRQLSFRQIAFSLLRRFSQGEMLESLKNTFGQSHFDAIAEIVNQSPSFPSKLPSQPGQIDLRVMDTDEHLSLQLPERIGKFSQNALVLQWAGAPFFYEQKLELVAQTANTVSRVNAVTQRDFHYQSPVPKAVLVARADGTSRRGSLFLPLQRLWDALSPLARQQWDAEAPGADGMRYAALPDLEVVYQLAELFSGNIEVQTEYYFGIETDPDVRQFQRRQLAKRLVPSAFQPLSPDAADNPLDAFALRIDFELPLDIPVQKTYDAALVLLPTNEHFEFVGADKKIRYRGILTREDVDNILWNAVQELPEIRHFILKQPDPAFATAAERRAFLQTWYSTHMIQDVLPLDQLQEELRNKLEIVEHTVAPDRSDFDPLVADKMLISTSELGWRGIITSAEVTGLTKFLLKNTRLYSGVRKTVLELLNGLAAEVPFTKSYQLQLDIFPGAPDNFAWSVQKLNNNDAKWSLTWNNLLLSQDATAALTNIRNRLTHPDFRAAVDLMIQSVHDFTESVTITNEIIFPGIPLIDTPTIPPDIVGKLTVEITNDNKNRVIKWTGKISQSEMDQLIGLQTQGDNSFKAGMAQLIAMIAQGLNSFNIKKEVTLPLALYQESTTALAAVAQLGGEITFDPAALSVTWKRNQLEVPAQTALFSIIDKSDPFLRLALEQVHAEVAVRTVTAALEKVRLLRCTQSLAEAERDALLAIAHADDQDAVENLYLDLADRQVLWEASDAFWSEQRVSEMPAANPSIPAGVAFETAVDCQLALTGRDTGTLAALTGPDVFLDGLERLKSRLQTEVIEVPVQIKSSAVPEDLQGFFRPAPTAAPVLFNRLVWKGALTDADKGDLRAWELGPEVQEAVEELIRRADEQVTVETIALIPDLPLQAAMPANLLLGTVSMRYHGWMVRQEGQSLAALFAQDADKAAVQRLYAASQRKLLHDRDFRLVCRRAAAPPSAMTPFDVLPLNEPNL